MIPNDAPSALRLFNLGPSMAARSQSSSCLVLRAARSPGVAVRVPSKSKKITAPPAAGSTRKASRQGRGDSGPGRGQAGSWGQAGNKYVGLEDFKKAVPLLKAPWDWHFGIFGLDWLLRAMWII